MLMYELVESEGLTGREVSVTHTIDTVETIPESATVSEVIPELSSDSEDESPALTERPSQHNLSTAGNTPSLLEMVESKLEGTHISPTSSVASNSTDDSNIDDVEQRTTRSTSFSSIHSRPRTPIFEVLDPQISPPPLKRVRRNIGGEEEVNADEGRVKVVEDGTD